MHRLLRFLMLTICCFSPSYLQTGCGDFNAFCGGWTDRGLCTKHRAFMEEQCPRMCGFCNTTESLFPTELTPSIANPDFICGKYDGSPVLDRIKRQFDSIPDDVVNTVGISRQRQNFSNDGNRSSSPNINPVRVGRNPSDTDFLPRQPSGNSFSNIPQPVRQHPQPPFPPTIPNIIPSRPVVAPSFFESITDVTPLPQDFTPFQPSQSLTIYTTATAIGGGTSAETPSVGIVLVVETTRPSIRPPATREPSQRPIVPRPTPVRGPTPVTSPPDLNPVSDKPTGPTPVPRPVEPIIPTPVSQPTQETSGIMPLTAGCGDFNAFCGRWTVRGLCTKHRAFMQEQCPRMCGFCKTTEYLFPGQTLNNSICGSVPITDRFLLSAAHCFFNQTVRYRVRLGDLDVSQTGEINSQPQEVDIERIFIHPRYDHVSGIRYNDIALLKTDRRIHFSSLVFPFCILPKPIDVAGVPLTVAGFGLVNGTYRDPALQAAELEGLNAAQCEQIYNSYGHDLSLRHSYPDLLVGKGILCASAPGKSACQGDSGRPLTLQDRNGKQYVLGVVSRGPPCLGDTLSILPGLYTDVAFHLDWIDEVIYGS